MIFFIIGLFFGSIFGIFLMCLFQINRTKENEREEVKIKKIYLYQRNILLKLSNIIDLYRHQQIDKEFAFQEICDVIKIIKK